MSDFILLTDGYKLDHRRQYPEGTQFVYSNFTARSSRVPNQKEVVFFGLQYFLKKYLTEIANATFFDISKRKILDNYKATVDSYLGPNAIGTDHIAALHDYGKIPLVFYALPEGTRVPLRMPMFTFENTHPDFFWVTNYIETLLSSVMWLGCTSASTAARYKKIFTSFQEMTGGPKDFVQWQGHDFSFRGMASPEAAALSGAAHLLSFTGTDTIPAIRLLEDYYSATGLVGGSVPATEHSVMCAGGQGGEVETFRRLLRLYPSGVLSVVSDTWDFWKVVTKILPELKQEITAREGKLVIRPDSGDPVKIIAGDANAKTEWEQKGLIQCLYEIFGGTTSGRGYRELDSHIGAIYGDSITEERALAICNNLRGKGFASTNVVFGIGSYTYNYVTRDTNGFAVKATWAQINNKQHLLSKAPKTDDGTKNSARGRIVIWRNDSGNLEMIDGLTFEDQLKYMADDLLQSVWENGQFTKKWTLDDIRNTISA